MRSLGEKLQKPFLWKTWQLLLASSVVGILCSASLIATLLFGSALSEQARQLNRTQNAQIAANARETERAAQLARALAPSDVDLARGASHALEVCLATPSCRRAFRGAVRKARLRPEDVPSLHIPADTTASGSGGNSGGGGGTSGNSGGAPGNSGGTVPPTSPRPPVRRPSQSPPVAAPAPSPSPSAPAAPASPSPATPAPSPPSSSPLPPVVRPPPTPTVPPVTVPPVVPPVVPPIRVCTPVIKVNCVNPKSGRVVGPEGHAADPDSNSGRGNKDEPLCERIKTVCPPGIIRFLP